MSIQLRKATIWLIALTGLSYFLAYLRDAEVAALYGASPVTDAFFVGTFLPATLYTIVIIGSFVPALLPVLSSVVVQSPESKVQSHGGLEAGVVVATSRWLVLSMLALVAVGELMAPWLIIILAPGFDAATADMATLFLRASLPILVFLGPAALAGAVLNFRHNFVAPALGSLVFAGTVFASVPMSGQGKLWVVSLAMVVGAALQLTLNVWALDPTMRRAVLAIWMSGDKEHARRVARLALPMLLCVALTQAMLLIERLLASSFPSGVLSHMAYAAKLNNLPVMVVATSLTTALFPGMARQAQGPDPASLAGTVRQGIGQATMLIAPISAWLITCSALIVPVVFGRGSFTGDDSAATAQLLSIYAVGLLPLALSLLLARAFYSKHETRPPIVAAAAGMTLYVILGIALRAWGAPGLALAIVIANWVGLTLLLVFLVRHLDALRVGDLVTDNLPRLVAAAITGTACLSLQPFWSMAIEIQGWVVQAAVLVALTIVAAATYLAAYLLLRWPATRNTQHATVTLRGKEG